MKQFATTATIRAPVGTVWRILTDASGYPAWNSTVDRIVGRIGSGEKLKLYTKAAPKRAFRLMVTELVPGHRMVWTGGMPLGLFKGQRTFLLTPKGPSAVDFSMREVFSGPLSSFIEKSIPDLQPEFDQFAADLKWRTENDSQFD